MDKKKKINLRWLVLFTLMTGVMTVWAQRVKTVEFCSYEYGHDGNNITLKFNLLDNNGEHIKDVKPADLDKHLQILEDDAKIDGDFEDLKDGIRIPEETTISILIDRSIDREGKKQIFNALKDLVYSAPDGCIFLSFFDEMATKSSVVNSDNFDDFKEDFDKEARGERMFFSVLLEKLQEFNDESDDGRKIAKKAKAKDSRNVMFFFVDGKTTTEDNEDDIIFPTFTIEASKLEIKPTIYAFYYTSDNRIDVNIEKTLEAITGESKKMNWPEESKGKYVSTNDNNEIFKKLGEAIEAQEYDYAFTYKAAKEAYSGKVEFSAKWNDKSVGEATIFNIGTPENPWPNRDETTTDIMLKYVIALLALLFTLVFFFVIMKIVVPSIKSKLFSLKYYKHYEPEYGVQSRKCSYCMQTVQPGEMVVTKCKHIIHVRCWKENDYRCAEYGQNCNTGIQEHLDWHELLTKSSLKECHQAFLGIFAGFFSWIVYELIGRGAFKSLSAGIAGMFLTEEPQRTLMLPTCSSKVSSFLAIGMLLGFFLSLVFRWNEEYRKKDFAIYMKILGLSILSSVIGLLSFAFGGIILCMMVSSVGAPDIPWYCSMPAYILFSVCTSLSLTIKTSIPIKSAMLGGLFSAFIGFIVLYFTNGLSSSYPWINMLFDFIIYGGGLGASLVTVRMLAEKYFLVIKNGPKAGTSIPIHKWMNATGGGNKVSIGISGGCEVQMNWEKRNKVAKEHAVLYIDQAKSMPVIKPMATNVIFNSRTELPVKKPAPLNNGDTFKIGDTIFLYKETD